MGYTSFGDRSSKISKDRLDFTLFLEKHLGGADKCYAYSRQTFITKLVTFVNDEVNKAKNG